LKKEGCERIYEEKISGAKKDRPQLDKLLSELKPKDILVVWKLDRLGRSVKHLITLSELLKIKNVELKCLKDPIDSTTAHGRFYFNFLCSLAELEREIISERTKAGLKAARARGNLGGRPKGLTKEAKKNSYLANIMYKEGELSTAKICETLGISRPTLYRYLKIRKDDD